MVTDMSEGTADRGQWLLTRVRGLLTGAVVTDTSKGIADRGSGY